MSLRTINHGHGITYNDTVHNYTISEVAAPLIEERPKVKMVLNVIETTLYRNNQKTNLIFQHIHLDYQRPL